MSIKENNSASILAGLLAGVGVGLILGIIYAPNKGTETRKKIKKKANDYKDQAKSKYLDVSVKVKDRYDAMSSTLNNVGNSVKDNYDKYKDQVVSKTTEIMKDVEIELDQLK